MAKKLARRATIYDVASEAGVSITTVSRFLNSTKEVKAETGERIAEAMENLDYIPHGNTGTRADRSVGRIGVLTPFFPAPSFAQRLEGIIPVFRSENVETVVYTIESLEQLDEYLMSVPFTRRIDGLILMSVRLTDEQRRTLAASGLHVVMVETDDDNYPRVLADDYQGGRIAAELFHKKDYFPCAYMGDRNKGVVYSLHPSEIRLNGFRETLTAKGRSLDPVNILESDTTVEDAESIFGAHLDRNGAPRAVFAMSDIQAIGILKAVRKRGLRVPEDIAVLGFDDIEAADWMELSSITQHLGDSGRIAAGLLLERIVGQGTALQKVNLQVELVERSTT